MTASILVATTQAEFSKLLHINLEEAGDFEVIPVKSCFDAFLKASEIEFPVAILDAMLPDQPFPDFVRALKDHFPALKILVIPPQNDPNHPALQQVSYDGLVSQPFYMPDLVASIERLVSESSAMQVQADAPVEITGEAPEEPEAELLLIVEPVVTADPGIGQEAADVLAQPEPPPDSSMVVDTTLPQENQVDAAPEQENSAPVPPGGQSNPLPVTSQPAVETMPVGLVPLENAADNSLDLDDGLSARLAELLGQCSAYAAVLLEEGYPIATAGKLSPQGFSEMSEILGRNWDPRRKSDLINFIRLSSDGSEHLLYATRVTEVVLLGVLSDAMTPLSVMRAQTSRLSQSILPNVQTLEGQEIPSTSLQELLSHLPRPEPAQAGTAAASDWVKEDDTGEAEAMSLEEELTRLLDENIIHRPSIQVPDELPPADEAAPHPDSVLQDVLSQLGMASVSAGNADSGEEEELTLEEELNRLISSGPTVKQFIPVITSAEPLKALPSEHPLIEEMGTTGLKEPEPQDSDILKNVMAQLKQQSDATQVDESFFTAEPVLIGGLMPVEEPPANPSTVPPEEAAVQPALCVEEEAPPAGEAIFEDVMAQLNKQTALAQAHEPLSAAWDEIIEVETGHPAALPVEPADVESGPYLPNVELLFEEYPQDIYLPLHENSEILIDEELASRPELELEGVPSVEIFPPHLPGDSLQHFLVEAEQYASIPNVLPEVGDVPEELIFLIRHPELAESLLPFQPALPEEPLDGLQLETSSALAVEEEKPVQTPSETQEPAGVEESFPADEKQTPASGASEESQQAIQEPIILNTLASRLEQYLEPRKNVARHDPLLEWMEEHMGKLVKQEQVVQEWKAFSLNTPPETSIPPELEPESLLAEFLNSEAAYPPTPEFSYTNDQEEPAIPTGEVADFLPGWEETPPAAQAALNPEVEPEDESPSQQAASAQTLSELEELLHTLEESPEEAEPPGESAQAEQEPLAAVEPAAESARAEQEPFAAVEPAVESAQAEQEPLAVVEPAAENELPAVESLQMEESVQIIAGAESVEPDEISMDLPVEQAGETLEIAPAPQMELEPAGEFPTQPPAGREMEDLEKPSDQPDILPEEQIEAASGIDLPLLEEISLEILPQEETQSLEVTVEAEHPAHEVPALAEPAVPSENLPEEKEISSNIRCPHCGKIHPADLEECPLTGQKISPYVQIIQDLFSRLEPGELSQSREDDAVVFPWETETPVEELDAPTRPVKVVVESALESLPQAIEVPAPTRQKPEAEAVPAAVSEVIAVQKEPDISEELPLVEPAPLRSSARPPYITPSNLTYTCALLPRLTETPLTGDLVPALRSMLPELAVDFGWKLEKLEVRPEYLKFTLQVMPAVSPGALVRIIRQRTSHHLFEQFPYLSEENASGDFWAPGSLIVNGAELASPQTLHDYINQTRRRQKILKTLSA